MRRGAKESNASRVGCELTVRSIGTKREVYVGLFQVEKFRTNLFPLATNQGACRVTRRSERRRVGEADVLTTCVRKNGKPVTDLYGRTFATWTSVTCVLCIVCARNVSSPAIYGACEGNGRTNMCTIGTVRFFNPCPRREGRS